VKDGVSRSTSGPVPPEKEDVSTYGTPGKDLEKQTYQRDDRVNVLGLVCAKMDNRVSLTRQEDEDRRVRQETDNLGRIVVNESGEVEDTEDV
jgi:hypothetical protein